MYVRPHYIADYLAMYIVSFCIEQEREREGAGATLGDTLLMSPGASQPASVHFVRIQFQCTILYVEHHTAPYPISLIVSPQYLGYFYFELSGCFIAVLP